MHGLKLQYMGASEIGFAMFKIKTGGGRNCIMTYVGGGNAGLTAVQAIKLEVSGPYDPNYNALYEVVNKREYNAPQIMMRGISDRPMLCDLEACATRSL